MTSPIWRCGKEVVMDEFHRYWVDGVRVLGVSEIIKHSGLVDFSFVHPEVLEHKRELGQWVHEYTEMLEEGTPFQDVIDVADPELHPYIQGWAEFVEDTGFVADIREEYVYDEEWKYCGKLDCRGVASKMGIKMLVDKKTGRPTKAAPYQTAAYEYRFPEEDRAHRFIVQLLKEPIRKKYYKLHKEHDDPDDIRLFRNLAEHQNKRLGWKLIQ